MMMTTLRCIHLNWKKKGIKVKPFNCSVRALFYLTLVAGISELPAFIIMDFNMHKIERAAGFTGNKRQQRHEKYSCGYLLHQHVL